MEKKKFKMNLNPTAGTGRGIRKPNLTHSQLKRGLACWILNHIHEKINFKVNPNPTAFYESQI
jgi:hypothetical protein